MDTEGQELIFKTEGGGCEIENWISCVRSYRVARKFFTIQPPFMSLQSRTKVNHHNTPLPPPPDKNHGNLPNREKILRELFSPGARGNKFAEIPHNKICTIHVLGI